MVPVGDLRDIAYAALDPHQNFIGGQDGHALYDLPDGVFIPLCDRLCGILYGLLCLLHAGADAARIGAALQDFFLLLFERSLLGKDFRELRVAGFFTFTSVMPQPPLLPFL